MWQTQDVALFSLGGGEELKVWGVCMLEAKLCVADIYYNKIYGVLHVLVNIKWMHKMDKMMHILGTYKIFIEHILLHIIFLIKNNELT